MAKNKLVFLILGKITGNLNYIYKGRDRSIKELLKGWRTIQFLNLKCNCQYSKWLNSKRTSSYSGRP